VRSRPTDSRLQPPLSVSRQGLYIIDLALPTRVPRFLPQGGLHSVADVQWSPHSSKPHSIVSTSSEKMLLWNLGLPSERGIEREVVAHRRAVTDINWAVFNDNVRADRQASTATAPF
jgi:hypothetical protein